MAEDRLDHWRVLANELGADVPPEGAAETHSEATQSPPHADDSSDDDVGCIPGKIAEVSEVALPPRTPPARRDARGWAELAEELGIEVTWEPEPAPTARDEGTSPATEPEIPSWDTPAPRESEVEREPEHDEPRRDREGPRRRSAEAEREDDRRGRRRRKRRRPGDDRAKQVLPVSDSVPSDDRLEDDRLEGEAEDDGEQPVAEQPELSGADRGEDAGRTRGKRRRRRRGSRRPSPVAGDSSESQSEAEADAVSSSSSQRAERASAEDDDDFGGDDDLAAEDHGEGSGVRSEKSLHRAIPSWFEAVNVIVAANLESRAKNPDRRSGNRGRGGHDRRGRDRGSDKPH